jgi:ATP-dependent DNA helicase RecG
MTLEELLLKGEDSTLQFKAKVTNIDALAAEMAAFANGEGGTILIGVSDTGEVVGLNPEEVRNHNNLISNAASQHIRSPLNVTTENILTSNNQVVIKISIPKGLDKPYFDKNGVIWLKTGSDKRRINSKEELKRIFQVSGQFHGDETKTKATVEHLDQLRFRLFIEKNYELSIPNEPEQLKQLLINMDLASEDGQLNLAGVLLFTARPEWVVPAFTPKAVSYPHATFSETDYWDSIELTGPLDEAYDRGFKFIRNHLHFKGTPNEVNGESTPEIPLIALQEILVNALVHRDYLIQAGVRIFIFIDRIEIHSPGHLPNNLTIERVKAGISNLRNPIIASFVAKGVLPYKGLGSGITRAMKAFPALELIDDRERNQFSAIFKRPPAPRLEN